MGKSSSVDRRKIYVRIADELRRDIAAGRYPVGETLPSIAKLKERFDSAGATIERALAVLREEGLIQSRQGSPSLVLAMPDHSEVEDEGESAQEPSEEFTLLSAHLQEMRAQIRSLSQRLDKIEERSRDS
ncbi:winged helix-turn-helix domain-containing protein [Actinomadura fulvescens]|uniref:HTH gntR-type domain-containing protein n=1 Tax=Actinomadura fulvescens TaxID=46160 RepID=A0ABP6CBK9_9ACTN